MNATDGRIKMNNVSVYMRQICSDMDRGVLGIPVWQRKFVWKPNQVIDLFDSISHGYPIGSFLVWSGDDYWKGSIEALSDEIDRDKTPKWYILDGRQRITAFYGCTSQNDNKESVFNLYYDLKNQTFLYPNTPLSYQLRVSDIFDTYILLGKLQRLKEEFADDEGKVYIDRAKTLNSVLQEYSVTKIAIEDCDLSEATKVFTRLNSKGTKVSNTEMAQALCYDKDGVELLIPVFERVVARLAEFNFDSIPSDEILKCFLICDSKNYIDTNLKDLERATSMLRHKEEVEVTAVRVASFLSEDCGVRSWGLLPYRRQFISLFKFFRINPHPTANQLKELKKWFFYTSLNKYFQNSSMGVVRNQFRAFDRFAEGKVQNPVVYDGKTSLQKEDFPTTSGSATFKLMLICMGLHHSTLNSEEDNTAYLGHCHFGSSAASAYFVLLKDHDKTEINSILNGYFSAPEKVLYKYCLDVNMVKAYLENDMDSYLSQRKEFIINVINDVLAETLK